MKLNKGFTLIELLVVIAIIGILSSVVLASLNDARTKGKQAAFKTEVGQAQVAFTIACDEEGATIASFDGGSIADDASGNCSAFLDGSGIDVGDTDDNSGCSAKVTATSTGITCS